MSRKPRPKGVSLPPVGPVQWLRSALFLVNIYAMMVVMSIAFLPWALLTPSGARAACKTYSRWVFWSARWMVGLRTEVRGPLPEGEVLIAAKHQSFLDIMMIFTAAPSARFIMKQEMLWTPLIGQYASRIGCVPVARGKRGVAMAKMVADVAKGTKEPGQLIIYPQGTRVAPGAQAPYKVGVGVLYRETGQPVVPVATNAGAFWPRTGIWRRPGTVVVEFLPVIEPGLAIEPFMERLEREVETASDRLLEETGLV
jgi:1-acyl-sn-glycerol-3-phosphate acyltransferase